MAQVLAWAKRTPDDPCMPEALHLAVRSTRYGCTNAKTTQFSKQADELLRVSGLQHQGIVAWHKERR